VLGLGYAEESVDSAGSDPAGAGDSGVTESRSATTNSTVVRPAKDPEATGVGAGGASPTTPPNTTPVWIALGGAFVVSVLAGVWVAARNSRKHG
jgi:hypothetical protein